MDKELFDYVAERADVLIASGSSTQVTRDAAQAWKDAVAADEVAADEATAKLVDVLDGRPTTIDGVIAFAQGAAVDMFGEEKAAEILATQLKRKEEGAKWFDCDACVAASEILAKFGRVELKGASGGEHTASARPLAGGCLGGGAWVWRRPRLC